MRSLATFCVASVSVLLTACSLDTEQFGFENAAGNASAGAAGTGGAATAGAAGTSAGAGGAVGGAGGSAGIAGAAGVGGAAGAGGSQAGAAGTGGSGGVAGEAGSGGSAGEAGAGGAPQAPCTKEIDGSRRCNGKIVEQCGDLVWTEITSCATGCSQKGVTAACTVCEAGTKACSGDKLQVCATDGTKYTDTGGQDCAATSLICEPTLNLCAACKPGTVKCVGASAITCNGSGVYDLTGAQDCGAAGLCTPGQTGDAGVGCKTTVCGLGDLQCEGDQIRYCKADFSGFEPAEACPAGTSCFDKVGCKQCASPDGTEAQYCKDPQTLVTCVGGVEKVLGICAAGGCAAAEGCKACVPGSFFCSADGTKTFVCGPNGQVASTVACTNGSTCDFKNGKCSVCEPNSFSCEGALAKQCKADGSGYDTTDCALTGQVCDGVSARCVSCLPRDRRCTDNLLEECSGAYEWGTIEKCGSAALCNPKENACIAPTCQPGEIRCKERSEATCKPDLTGYDPGAKCEISCLPDIGCSEAYGVSVGGDQACAIVSKKNVPVCWGKNTVTGGGTLFGGAGGEVAPRVVKGLQDIVKIESGDSFMCALNTTGALLCWGDNALGQLGDGTTATNNTPTTVPGLGAGVTDFSVSSNGGVCAVVAGNLLCWGRDPLQVAGQPDTFKTSPQDIVKTGKVAKVAVGAQHRCLVDVNGGAQCWGRGGSGQLGNGTTVDAPLPSTPVSTANPKGGFFALKGILTISVSSAPLGHSCVQTADALYCWGSNGQGQIGLGTGAPTTVPYAALVPNTEGFENLTIGNGYSCATYKTAVSCWGAGRYGVNGNPAEKNYPSPTAIGLEKVVRLDAGLVTTCALTTSGAVSCFGVNGSAQLGQPSASLPFSGSPVPVELP